MKKKIFSFTRKKSKNKNSKEQPKDNKNKVLLEIKKSNKIFINNLRKNHKDKIDAIKKFILIISGYGFVINYALHFIFGFDFNLFTLFSWGIAYYFINDEFVEWFRRLIARR